MQGNNPVRQKQTAQKPSEADAECVIKMLINMATEMMVVVAFTWRSAHTETVNAELR